tara:strand:- start:406 stop:576 length:171 start_codon:yes stop_codon:yes gene_type:complete
MNNYDKWLEVGIEKGYLKSYNIERDKSMMEARIALEKAFTPELKKMLEDHIGKTKN